MRYDDEPWDLLAVRRAAQTQPDMTAQQIGEKLTARMSKAQLRDFAVNYIADWVDMLRRADVREVERQAVRPEPAPSAFADCEKWLADPVKHWHISNNRDRDRFKRWAGDRFEAWRTAARAAAEAAQELEPYAVRMFEGDWYPDGAAAYERNRRETRLAADIKVLVDTVSRDVRLETTRELLESVFALGDGQRVTWGEATVADHQQRVGLLLRNAAGNAEAAARHAAAIRMIEEAGVKCLAEVPAGAEAVAA